MSTVTRRALAAWLTDHGFAELGGKATSHRAFAMNPGVVITVPGHDICLDGTKVFTRPP